MIGQRSGKIVNIASISGQVVNKYFHGGSYEVSKAALMMLTKTLATEWARHNIVVNAIAPGYYDTQPNRDFFAQEADLYQRVRRPDSAQETRQPGSVGGSRPGARFRTSQTT